MHVRNKIQALIMTFSPTCFGTYCAICREDIFTFAPEYCYILWLLKFAAFIQLLKQPYLFHRRTWDIKVLVWNTWKWFASVSIVEAAAAIFVGVVSVHVPCRGPICRSARHGRGTSRWPVAVASVRVSYVDQDICRNQKLNVTMQSFLLR
jgi:hypothetical protein